MATRHACSASLEDEEEEEAEEADGVWSRRKRHSSPTYSMRVARLSRSACEKPEAENLRARHSVPDEPAAYSKPVNMAVAWKSGRHEKMRICSPRSGGASRSICRGVETMTTCRDLMRTALGLPLVPEVKMSMAVSCGRRVGGVNGDWLG